MLLETLNTIANAGHFSSFLIVRSEIHVQISMQIEIVMGRRTEAELDLQAAVAHGLDGSAAQGYEAQIQKLPA